MDKKIQQLIKFLKSKEGKKEVRTWIYLIVLILAFKSSFFGNFTVPTGSMVPTILVGDKLIANMVAYNLRIPFTNHVIVPFSKPKHGDIVVFDNPKDPSISYVKRLIGLPGDVVRVKDGQIIVNDFRYELTVIDKDIYDVLEQGGFYRETGPSGSYTVQRKPHFPNFETKEWTVPEGHYFFMGDNRDRSSDSREWGFVPEDHIKGRAQFVYFSFKWPDINFSRIGTALN